MILIKGMEMPKNCFRCDLVCKCRWYLDTDTRPYNCPLVEVPSVDTERKTGKWIRRPEWEEDGGFSYECDQCGMGSDVDYNFCMRCGAKMEV